MEVYARAPDPLTKTDDMASNWHSWKEHFIIFMQVTGYINKSKDIRANLLKTRIGKIGIDAIKKMSFDKPEDKDDIDILIAKLEDIFNPKNEAYERYKFFTTGKKRNETIEQYINILKDKAKTCNFNELTDSIIRDKIILNTQDKILRKKFFEVNKLNLQQLVAIYNYHNINTVKMKQVTKKTTESKRVPHKVDTKSSTERLLINNNAKKKCWRCNTQHPQGKCPAWESKCTKCGDVNHFTQCCQGPKSKAKPNEKNNNQGRNQTNSVAKDMDPMNKMISFPDIPTVPCSTTNSASNNDTDFVMLSAHNPSSSLSFNNTTSQPTYISKSTQYNSQYDSHIKGTTPKVIFDVPDMCMYSTGWKTQASSSQIMSTSNNNFQNILTHRAYTPQSAQFRYNQKKKKDCCILS
ncbi:uncharacterized protein LOC114940885 isoform X2 [Nylanderia fulva]|uniref:uncharacterized protein LOC114940885 isoform X2 n=1 Tax=Nylanderia fulva TaxID=613905 RepID=UPI0010FB6CCA|nr:uncharacterized protein LOC114940885 isoform X2 [Nylanderia fulva]